MSDLELAYEADGVLVVPWRISDPWEDYTPRIGDPIVPRQKPNHLGEIIELQTPEELAALPDGTLLISISGQEKIKGTDEIDTDTRAGRTAFGLPDRRGARP